MVGGGEWNSGGEERSGFQVVERASRRELRVRGRESGELCGVADWEQQPGQAWPGHVSSAHAVLSYLRISA